MVPSADEQERPASPPTVERALDNSNSSSYDPPLPRDEVNEARRISKDVTKWIRLWRVVAVVVLVVVAVCVTSITSHYLTKAQEETFHTAFEQFSRTVGLAALKHHGDLLEAYETLADTISDTAMAANATWPFYALPYFEQEAAYARGQASTEMITIAHIVQHSQLEEWLDYTDDNYQQWIKESHLIDSGNLDRLDDDPSKYHRYMYGGLAKNATRDFYLPTTSFSPPPNSYGFINYDGRSIEHFEKLAWAGMKLRETVIAPVREYSLAPGVAFTLEEHDAMHSRLRGSMVSHPHTTFGTPIYERAGDRESKIVAFVVGVLALDVYLRGLLPADIYVTCVVSNTCGQVFTYEIEGHEAFFAGDEDLHQTKYDGLGVNVAAWNENSTYVGTPGHCVYSVQVYPNDKLEDKYLDDTPKQMAIMVAFTFVLVGIVCFVYDIFIHRRNESLVVTAARSNSIVAVMYPEEYRERMVAQLTQGPQKFDLATGSKAMAKPLADLFLESSVLYADLAGFTAWSSTREPHQVFSLLETLYGAFDSVAKRRRIFKVETVRDCYVAASGIPEYRKDHAVSICRFAHELIKTSSALLKSLILTLGPDTGDLSVRIGIHSGPVTAGVLRGERARFQLFGDTVNTASRMESTSAPGKVQLSSSTTELLVKSGKGSWVERRVDKVIAKGTVAVETYWLVLGQEGHERAVGSNTSSNGSSADSDAEEELGETAMDSVLHKYALTARDSSSNLSSSFLEDEFDERTAYLIDWNSEILVRLLFAVVAHRSGQNPKVPTRNFYRPLPPEAPACWQSHGSFVEEVAEIIHLPEFDKRTARLELDPSLIELAQPVVEQLRHYVSMIANMYKNNPFHNFEHASHVMMSMNKLMSRIVSPFQVELDDTERDDTESNGDAMHPAEKSMQMAATLHDHTYGITSDPLTQFACAVSALIHDVDHEGVPNVQLVKEESEVVSKFGNRSPAEQNSLNIAWDLLMEDTYTELREAIVATVEEKERFRQLLVNSVMATDIVDRDLKALRNQRWDKAFKLVDEVNGEQLSDSDRDIVNRKATIVIEHLIQASDVSHTMQHWHIYRRWNENFFRECYKAYRHGRADTDPSIGWYKGELGFFDFYIIPLAKKLKECGVFGKSSGELLDYATKNRNEWEQRGEEVVKEMLRSVELRMLRKKDGSGDSLDSTSVIDM